MSDKKEFEQVEVTPQMKWAQSLILQFLHQIQGMAQLGSVEMAAVIGLTLGDSIAHADSLEEGNPNMPEEPYKIIVLRNFEANYNQTRSALETQNKPVKPEPKIV